MKSSYLMEFFLNSPTAYAFLSAGIDENGYFYDSRIIDANEAFGSMMNLKRCDVLGKTYTEVFSSMGKVEKAKWEYASSMAFLHRKPATVYLHMEWNDTWFRVEAFPLEGDTFGVIYNDVTSEFRLDEERARFENILEASGVGTWEWNIETGEVKFNERWAEIVGYKLSDISPASFDTWTSLIHPDDLKHAMNLIEMNLRGESDSFFCENRMMHRAGHYVWVLDRGKVTRRNQDGTPYIMAGTHTDITPRKTAEESLQEAEKRYSLAIDGADAGLWDWDMLSGRVYYSRLWLKMLGYQESEIDNTIYGWRRLWHPDEAGMIDKAMDDYLGGLTEKYEITHRLRHKNGDWRWILARGGVLKNGDGTPYRFVGTNMDITDMTIERHNSEELERFFSVTQDLISFSDLHGNYIKLNKAWTDLLGYSTDDIMGRKFLDLIHPDDVEATLEISRQFVSTGEISGFISRIRCKDGSYKSLEWNSKLFGNTVYSAARDVTEKLEREKRVKYLSYHDVLTGLFNRRFMEEEIRRLDTKRSLPISIIMGDVNRLKLINDAFGHEMGDELLIKASASIQKGCRSSDLIARWGGDEFIIFLPSTDHVEAHNVIQRILESCSGEKVMNMDVSISFGIATKTSEDELITSMMRIAEEDMYRNKRLTNHHARGEIINAIQSSLYNRDSHEEDHARRVAKLSRKTGRAMGLNDKTIKRLYLGGLMHDIGKIAINPDILEKPGRLNDDEIHEVMRHSEVGCKIVSTTQELLDVARIILAHHERPDGKGYPEGLKEGSISVEAKIIAIAESFDSMTSSHPYRSPMTREEAVDELRRNKGTQFDPDIIDIFIEKVVNEMK